MTDMTQQQLKAAVEQSFDQVADQVFDEALINQIEAAASPADFRVSESRLEAASATALASLPMNVTMLALTAGAGADWVKMASDDDGPRKVNTERVAAAANDENRQAAAHGIRDHICNEARERFEKKLNEIKEWVKGKKLEDVAKEVKQLVKKLGSTGKRLVVAAVTAIAGVVGSTLGAYLLIGVAIAAVGAAIYFLVKDGLPNFCQA